MGSHHFKNSICVVLLFGLIKKPHVITMVSAFRISMNLVLFIYSEGFEKLNVSIGKIVNFSSTCELLEHSIF